MNLEEQTKLIEQIKEKFDTLIGKEIHVEQDLGRSRISANTGIVYQVHPRLFILEVERKRMPKARMSFQYADILTGVVQVMIDGESIFEDYQELLAVKKEPFNETDFSSTREVDERIIS